MPPTAGLQDIWPMRSRFSVTSAVSQPMRAAADAASQPACPAPITITSKVSSNIKRSLPEQEPFILSDAQRFASSLRLCPGVLVLVFVHGIAVLELKSGELQLR